MLKDRETLVQWASKIDEIKNEAKRIRNGADRDSALFCSLDITIEELATASEVIKYILFLDDEDEERGETNNG